MRYFLQCISTGTVDVSNNLAKIYFLSNTLHCLGPKKLDFWPKINLLKENHRSLWFQLLTVCQKGPKSYFQSDFSMSRIIRIFLIFLWIKNYRSTIFEITISYIFNFSSTLFCKSMLDSQSSTEQIVRQKNILRD